MIAKKLLVITSLFIAMNSVGMQDVEKTKKFEESIKKFEAVKKRYDEIAKKLETDQKTRMQQLVQEAQKNNNYQLEIFFEGTKDPLLLNTGTIFYYARPNGTSFLYSSPLVEIIVNGLPLSFYPAEKNMLRKAWRDILSSLYRNNTWHKAADADPSKSNEDKEFIDSVEKNSAELQKLIATILEKIQQEISNLQSAIDKLKKEERPSAPTIEELGNDLAQLNETLKKLTAMLPA